MIDSYHLPIILHDSDQTPPFTLSHTADNDCRMKGHLLGKAVELERQGWGDLDGSTFDGMLPFRDHI